MKLNYLSVRPPRWKGDSNGGVAMVNGVRVHLLNGERGLMEERREEDYQRIKAWCQERVLPYMTRRTFNPRRTSYGLKHDAEKELGFYVCNADIKIALAELGVPHSYLGQLERINHFYPISEAYYRDLWKRRQGSDL